VYAGRLGGDFECELEGDSEGLGGDFERKLEGDLEGEVWM
jgi:hypothetical protein